MDGIELSALDTRAGANAGFWLKLRHPVTHALLPGLRLKMLGMDSDRYQAKASELLRRRQEELARGAPQRITPEEHEERARELLAEAVVGWEGVKIDGKVVEFSEARRLEILKRFPWIYEQANLAVVDRGNFLPGSENA
jgi:hypothetical protein